MKNGASLSEHRFNKGKFIAPFNDGIFKDMLKENPWFKNRLPEYFWLALILDFYGRNQGLIKCRDVLQTLLKHAPDISMPRMSSILSLPKEKQKDFYEDIKKIIDKSVLEPLTVVLTYSRYPQFAEAFCTTTDVSERIQKINEVMAKHSDHRSNEATDVRYMIVVFLILANKLCLQRNQVEDLLTYPVTSHECMEMRRIRSFIRAMEISLPDDLNETKEQYLFDFWDGVSRMSECELFYVEVDCTCPETQEFMSKLKKQLEYFTELFEATHPLDAKMLVLLGIATYSYKRLFEVVEHELYNTIVGRSVIRVLIEDYIMMKYLLKHESEHDDIWTEYEYYGIGQYKLIVERFRAANLELPTSHVRYDYLDILVGEYKNKDFIDMDTSYFGKKNIREKAIEVGEKDLFGLYYDYDSAFEHGLWGAIRESSLIKCDTPSHQYHCVPDVDNNQIMQSVWEDCKSAMIQTMNVLHGIYGCPAHLRFEETTDE